MSNTENNYDGEFFLEVFYSTESKQKKDGGTIDDQLICIRDVKFKYGPEKKCVHDGHFTYKQLTKDTLNTLLKIQKDTGCCNADLMDLAESISYCIQDIDQVFLDMEEYNTKYHWRTHRYDTKCYDVKTEKQKAIFNKNLCATLLFNRITECRQDQ